MQTGFDEDIDCSTLVFSDDHLKAMYLNSFKQATFAFFVEGCFTPIIQNSCLLKSDSDNYAFGYKNYFAQVDNENKIIVYQYSPLHFKCFRVKLIQSHVYNHIEGQNKKPELLFLKNDNIMVLYNGEITIVTPEGIVINSIQTNTNIVYDSNCCRLWSVDSNNDSLLIKQIKLINVFENNDIAYDYTSDTIDVIPNNIHSSKKINSFKIPPNIMNHYHSLCSLQVYPYQDNYMVVLQHEYSITLFDYSLINVATIPTDISASKGCVKWVFTKNYFVLLQLLPGLLHVSIYHYPEMSKCIYDSLLVLPSLPYSLASQKNQIGIERTISGYCVGSDNKKKQEKKNVIRVQRTESSFPSFSNASLELDIPSTSNQASPRGPEILIKDLNGNLSIEDNEILIVDCCDDVINTLIMTNEHLGILSWKLVVTKELIQFTCLKKYQAINGKLTELVTSIPTRMKTIVDPNQKIQNTTFILWSNFLLSMTQDKTESKLISDNVHSFNIPYSNLLLTQQTNQITIRHLDSISIPLSIPIKLSLLI